MVEHLVWDQGVRRSYRLSPTNLKCTGLAQMVERRSYTADVIGSIPIASTNNLDSVMDKETYVLALFYLNKIENALNNIAVANGHPTMDVFFDTEKQD